MTKESVQVPSIDGVAKSSRRAAMVSLIGAIVVIVSLVYAFQQLISLERTIEFKKHELIDIEKRKQDLLRENELLEQQGKLLRSAVETASERNPALIKESLDSAAQSYPEAARSVPRVYVHISRKNQLERAQVIQNHLRNAGLVVPGIEYVGANSPKVSQLRYFHQTDEEKAQAHAIASKLEKLALKLEVIPIKGYEKSGPGSFEIWLSADVN